MKKLIPAIVLLLISAMIMATASYAWFSMNTTVTATGMQVKAKAEQGILINEESTANSASWDNSATANATQSVLLRATSTANTKDWYVAYSSDSADAAVATAGSSSTKLVNGYNVLSASSAAPYKTAVKTTSASAGDNAEENITYADANSNSAYDNGEGYYVKYTYYIKSSAEQITTGLGANDQNIKVSVSAETTTGSPALDAALRVAVVIGATPKAYIFAPVASATTEYYVNASSTKTTALTGEQATQAVTIPAATAAGMKVDIYIWFEGEDANLMTNNITNSLDDLSIEVSFSLVKLATAGTDNGVNVG